MSSGPEPVFTTDAPFPLGPYVQAIKAGGLVYVSGQIPATPQGEVIKGTIEECTEVVLSNVGAILRAAGSGFNMVLKTTVFLSDMGDFAGMNSVYAEYFSDYKAARSCVAAKTLPKDVPVVIECIAMEDCTPGAGEVTLAAEI